MDTPQAILNTSTQGQQEVPSPALQDNTSNDSPNQRVIEVQNPTKEEMEALKEHVRNNAENSVTVKDVTFKFKKSVDRETLLETIRKPVDLAVPYPNIEGLMTIIENGGKGLELLFECMEQQVNSVVRDILNDAGGTELDASNFPVDKLSWNAIAALPKAQRRGGGIPKEVWEAFQADYIEVMVSATEKTVEQVTNAAKILHNKLATVKTNEPVLNLLVGQLAIYAEASPSIEEYSECVEFLLQKADTFLNITDEELIQAL